jgi:hypothetical protein
VNPPFPSSSYLASAAAAEKPFIRNKREEREREERERQRDKKGP